TCCSIMNHSICFFFFFQAEDGIRDFHVTGVQTCALPISLFLQWYGANELKTIKNAEQTGQACSMVGEALYCGLYLNELLLKLARSEERRVGKECRSRRCE